MIRVLEVAVTRQEFDKWPLQRKAEYLHSHPHSEFRPKDADLKSGRNWAAHELHDDPLHHLVEMNHHRERAMYHLAKADEVAAKALAEDTPHVRKRLHERAGRNFSLYTLHNDWARRHAAKAKELNSKLPETKT